MVSKEESNSIPNRLCYGPEDAQRRRSPLILPRRTPIPFDYVLAESNSPSGSNTITVSDVCASDVRVSGEHPPFLVNGVIIWKGGLSWEANIVVHNIERVGTGRKVALWSNNDSDGIADPFVGPLRELECVEGLEWYGEAMDPIPI